MIDRSRERAETQTADAHFESLLEFIRQHRGFDFTGYKRPSLLRRIQKRMDAVRVESHEEYRDFLEANQDEFAELFDTVLINVTGFFRDRPAWDYVAQELIPRLVESKHEHEPIRLWSAGCASGEEAYSLAILFAEALGEDAFRRRVKVYATDVDEHALRQGRHASYNRKELEGVPEELRERYFVHSDAAWTFKNELRRSVIFGRHDLLRDPPISRIDLLACRNTLMYFGGQTQSKILGDFSFALDSGGYLFLGKSEMLLARSRLFEPVALKHRVFALVRVTDVHERAAHRLDHYDRPPPVPLSDERLRAAGLDAVPLAVLAVDKAKRLALVNATARRLFGLTRDDIGRPFQDLEVSYRPVDLRSRLDEVESTHRAVAIRDVELREGGETQWYDVQLAPLTDFDGASLGAVIEFSDVTRYRGLQESFELSKERLETAYEELQSTNEELETMNEELQSTNEELETMNDELRLRSEELNESNAFLESVLSGLEAAVAVVDRELVVRSWNSRATDLWGLRDDEVEGRHLNNLELGFPVDRVADVVRRCLADEGTPTDEVEAVTRRGRRVTCLVRCSPLWGPRREVRGVIVQMEARELEDA